VEVLNAARAALNVAETEVEAACIVVNGAEACRVDMCLGMISVLLLTFGELWFP
jgi:hypothetical protein